MRKGRSTLCNALMLWIFNTSLALCIPTASHHVRVRHHQKKHAGPHCIVNNNQIEHARCKYTFATIILWVHHAGNRSQWHLVSTRTPMCHISPRYSNPDRDSCFLPPCSGQSSNLFSLSLLTVSDQAESACSLCFECFLFSCHEAQSNLSSCPFAHLCLFHMDALAGGNKGSNSKPFEM